MGTTDLADRKHEPYRLDKGETYPWCRACTEHYKVGITYPCSHVRKEGTRP